MTWAILTDVSKCIGCEECVKACQETRGLPQERPWPWLRKISDLSSSRWTTLVDLVDDQGSHYVRRQCRHCLEPECVSVCIVGALKKTDEGPVIYDPDICIGCRYCMIACPWEIPRYSWEDTVPYIQKCDMCYERLTNGAETPACVEACPTEATIFGDRDELLAEAHRRLAAGPDKYLPKVWGESELGGTSVMYISDIEINLTDLDKPIMETAAMPPRTTKILHQMPFVFVLMAGAMGGVNWVITRRQKLAAEAARTAKRSEADPTIGTSVTGDENSDGAEG
jgi:formate dehydrogenase iron-sulfur subunit